MNKQELVQKLGDVRNAHSLKPHPLGCVRISEHPKNPTNKRRDFLDIEWEDFDFYNHKITFPTTTYTTTDYITTTKTTTYITLNIIKGENEQNEQNDNWKLYSIYIYIHIYFYKMFINSQLFNKLLVKYGKGRRSVERQGSESPHLINNFEVIL